MSRIEASLGIGIPILELDEVGRSFGAYTAVDAISLRIAKGEFLAIMGPSGCGKTTTLRMLSGLDVPSCGEIRLEGRRINELPAWRRETPLVWQSLALFPFLDVLGNVEFGLRMRGLPAAERRRQSMRWLERLEMAEFASRTVAQLSGGQRQRVALARSLVTEPPVLLLDEPLSALDASLSLRMQGLLKGLQRELGITFVYVTHNHSEAFGMADRVAIMRQGRIEQVGRPRDIVRSPASRFVAEFIGGNNLFSGRLGAEADGLIEVDTDEGLFQVASPGLAALPGSPVDLIVAADRVSVSRQTGWAANELPCRVMAEEFVGAFVNLHLETSRGKRLLAQLQQRDLDTLDAGIGDGVVACWHPQDFHVLPAAPSQVGSSDQATQHRARHQPLGAA